MRGGLMVCGTGSDVGKGLVVAALCRALARDGVRVAPFKAQNMSLNSFVTPTGHEIGRAQAAQALAARAVPEVAMNPILLKPTSERTSQVVLFGEPVGALDAAGYHALKPALLARVLDALQDLRRRFDVVLLEGAGSPAEINLLAHDIVNLRIADEGALPAVVVGDIDRGGVFAALAGTVALLPRRYRRLLRGFVINKFRGDPALLAPGLAAITARTGIPVLGVLPFTTGLGLDAEDSLALRGPRPGAASTAPVAGDGLDVAAVAFPHLSNFTDLDPLAIEPAVGVRFVDHPAALGDPDVVVLPGTKATVDDLDWLRTRGFAAALAACRDRGATILGICGGYQMLGRTIVDDVESGRGQVAGLGWLDVGTVFGRAKVTRQRRGRGLGQPVAGYQIHHGVVSPAPTAPPWLVLAGEHGDEPEGARDGAVLGTTLHGLFEEDGFRARFLADAAARRGRRFLPAGVSFAAARERQFETLADLVEAHLDMTAIRRIIVDGAAGARKSGGC